MEDKIEKNPPTSKVPKEIVPKYDVHYKESANVMIQALNVPLPPEAISQHPTKAYLSTIKAIYVVERFNQVFGLGGWYISNEVVEKVKVPTKNGEVDNVIIKATFHAPQYGIVVPDIFGGNDNPDLGDAYKGACTDALTKIGSYLGVGMDVYKGLKDSHKQNSAPTATERPKVVSEANKGLPMTPKQKSMIKSLMTQKGIFTLKEAGIEAIEKPTMSDASGIIKKLMEFKKDDVIQMDESYEDKVRTQGYVEGHEND